MCVCKYIFFFSLERSFIFSVKELVLLLWDYVLLDEEIAFFLALLSVK